MRLLLCAVVAAVLAVGPSAQPAESATSTTITTIPHDSFFDSATATTSWGTLNLLYVKSCFSGSNCNRRTVIKFDVSSLPADAAVKSANLEMLMTTAPAVSRTYQAYRVTSNWTEGTGGNFVSWTYRLTGSVAWTTAGGDYTGTAVDVLTGTTAGVWLGWDIKDMVQGWVTTPATNFGTLIKDSAEGNTSIYTGVFPSSEDATAGNRPKLTVGYLRKVTGLAAAAGTNQVSLTWTNPGTSPAYNGTLIIRKAGGAPTWTPADGTAYNAGYSPDGGATEVVLNDTSLATAFTDTGLPSGPTYYYQAFARDSADQYSFVSSTASATLAVNITLVTSGTVRTQTAANPACALPSGIQNGDIGLWHTLSKDNVNHDYSGAAGWTKVTQVPQTTLLTHSWAWTRFAGGESGNVTVSISGTLLKQCKISLWRGVRTSGNPFEAWLTAQGTSNVINPAAVLITNSTDVIVALMAVADDNHATNALDPMSGGSGVGTVVEEYEHPTATGSDSNIALHRAPATTTGSVDLGSDTMLASEAWVTFTIALVPLTCGSVDDVSYVAASDTAGTDQVTVYWSSASPALILRKTTPFGASDTPESGTSYSAGNTLNGGATTVVYSGVSAPSSFTDSGLTAGTTYYYKVFAKAATPCYSPGVGVDVANQAAAPTAPVWSYTMAGGSMLKPGIAGNGSIYIASNASRIASLDTTSGLQSWSPVTTTQPVQGWLTWVPNNGYSSRQTVTITAGAPGAPNGYSVPITLNHASLVAAGSSRADGNDVRVVYWSGASGVELDRVLDAGSAWNTATTKIWIKTQAAIGASGADSNYYVYYGNPVAGSPPANPMSVYLFYDDFSGAAIDTTKWTVTAGSVTLSGGIATVNANSGIFANPAYAFGVDVRSEARVQLTGDGLETYFDFLDAVTLTDWTGAVIAMYTDATNFFIDSQIVTGQRTVLTPGLATPLNWHTYEFNREGTAGVRFFQDSTQLGYINTNVPTVNMRSYILTNTTPNTMKLDWHRVRRYVTPEPTTALATAESQTWGSIVGGDQSGRVYSVDAVVGTANWTRDLSAQADAIQAGIAAQVWSYSDAAFQAAYTTDVLFAASRNTGVTNCGTAATNNKLFALRADTGATLWTFNATCTYSIDYIVGMPYVDYTRNRVYLATRGTGSTLWILNSLNGAVVQQLVLGHLDTSPALSVDGATIYVSTTNGRLYAVDATTFTATSYNLASAVKSVIWEDWSTPGRLYFTTMDGNLWCLQHDGGASFTQVWKVPVAGASTPLFLDKLYVGSSDGRLHEFDINGLNEKVFPASGTLDGTTVGDVSTEDGSHVFVGTGGGKLFKIQIPLP